MTTFEYDLEMKKQELRVAQQKADHHQASFHAYGYGSDYYTYKRYAQQAAKLLEEVTILENVVREANKLTPEQRRQLRLHKIIQDGVVTAKNILADVEGKMCLTHDYKAFMYITARSFKDVNNVLYLVLNTTSPSGEETKPTTGIRVPVTGHAVDTRITNAIRRISESRNRWLEFAGQLSLQVQ